MLKNALRKISVSITAFIAVTSLAVGSARADLHGVDITNNNTNSGYDVGWAFSTNAPITVTQLGKFVIGGTTADSEVGIYSNNSGSSGGSGTLLIDGIVPANAPTELSGALPAQYVSITPQVLPAGNYVVFGRQHTELFAETATATFGSGITYVAGVATDGQSSAALPTNLPSWSVYNNGPGHYFGPTFQYTQAPEPGSLTIVGLAGMGLLARRRLNH